MVNFRSQWRDLEGWRSYNLPLNTSSNQAVKLYDATLDQMVYYYNDPQLGGVGETMNKMLAEDPDFVAGNLLKHSISLFMTNSDEAKKQWVEYSATLGKDLSSWEKGHVVATQCMYNEDIVGALENYAALSRNNPYDLHSFNFAFMLGLVTGHTYALRDVPLGIVDRYKPHMPHYGLVHGKLCFGHAEMAEYDQAKRCGKIALDAFPLDSWGVHALTHTYDNLSEPRQVVELLERTDKHWTRGVNFSQHIHWHKAGAHTNLQEYETALSIYDNHLQRFAHSGDSFPLSDASSLLMRLRIEGQNTNGREKALAKLWAQHHNEFVCLFYDGHAALAAAMVGDSAGLEELLENMREFIAGSRTGWNKLVTSQHGVALIEGIKLMGEEDYGGATDKLAACVPHLVKLILGSKAQKSIFSMVLVHCALLSGTAAHLALAEQHLRDWRAWTKVDQLPSIQQRLWDKIQLAHVSQ